MVDADETQAGIIEKKITLETMNLKNKGKDHGISKSSKGYRWH